jgi:hypothetical protein
MSIGCCVRRLSPARPGDLPAVAWAGAQDAGNLFRPGRDDHVDMPAGHTIKILAIVEGD